MKQNTFFEMNLETTHTYVCKKLIITFLNKFYVYFFFVSVKVKIKRIVIHKNKELFKAQLKYLFLPSYHVVKKSFFKI